MTELEQALHDLAAARNESAQLKWQYDAEYAMRMESLAPMAQSVKDAKATEADAETKVRTLALAAYNDTGSKEPAKGVVVKLFQTINYDAAKAFEWAKEHSMCLKLDTSAFDKVAKAGQVDGDLVTISQEPRATISTDLSGLLE